ncbi:hypothetical protein [Shimazuella alba]|uniref:Uncharacterized protein n=1 Tax=Shimazuella alba TaxID=2690964 RepID=A0A6I4VS43_9BACL|nr:hypothetical protein [Shimazuella alba]MXQ53065.1 hypothetical protein [Shimazuella alba]
MGDMTGALSGLLAGFFLAVIIIVVIFAVLLFIIYRQLVQIKGLLQGSNFYLMTLAQTLGDRKAAARAAMHHLNLKEIEAIQFLNLLQMSFPEDEEEHH